jgi:cbb3-type cytochrome oxidase cytochrome c subunit
MASMIEDHQIALSIAIIIVGSLNLLVQIVSVFFITRLQSQPQQQRPIINTGGFAGVVHPFQQHPAKRFERV